MLTTVLYENRGDLHPPVHTQHRISCCEFSFCRRVSYGIIISIFKRKSLLTFHPWPSWYRRWFSQRPSSDHFRIFFFFLQIFFQTIFLGKSHFKPWLSTEVTWITDMLLITCANTHSQLEAHFPGESHCIGTTLRFFSRQIWLQSSDWGLLWSTG